MKTKVYMAYPSIRDHWSLRCMSRSPDQVVSLKIYRLDWQVVCLQCGRIRVRIKRKTFWVVGSIVVRAPDSGPEALGSMPVPPNTLRVHAEYVLVKSVGPKVLCAESRVQGTGENFPSTSVPCLTCGGGDRRWRHLS
ncbi:hypothetical protein TNCV_3554161 [Trichonephila clavipes]|nr:hypothetical protein TNCV_3554161 [Trichonephila clavipes]